MLLLACAGCAGPSVVWFGRSADRRHVVEVVERKGMQRVRLDGKVGPECLGVGLEGLALSPDGAHVAYPARLPDGWTVVVDGRRGEAWDGIASVLLDRTGRHHAYGALRGAAWRVVHDGVAGPGFEDLHAGSLVFASSGRLGYAGRREGKAYVVVDGQAGAPFDAVGALAFSEDGASFAYQGRRGADAFAVVDGAESGPFEGVAEVSLSPARGRVALVVRGRGGWRAVIDGTDGAVYSRLSAVTWSADGRRYAYAARRGEAEVVVLDGIEWGPYDAVVPGTLRFDGSGLRFAFAATVGGKARMVLDGQPGAAFDEVGPPVFAPGAFGYLAFEGGSARIVLDGEPGPPFPWVADLVFSRDGKRHAYLASDGTRPFVAHPGGRSPFDLVIEGTLAFSPDGAHWGCAAGEGATRKLFISIDGVPWQAIDAEELVAVVALLPPAERFSRPADAVLLRRWVEAELAKVSLGRGRTPGEGRPQ